MVLSRALDSLCKYHVLQVTQTGPQWSHGTRSSLPRTSRQTAPYKLRTQCAHIYFTSKNQRIVLTREDAVGKWA